MPRISARVGGLLLLVGLVSLPTAGHATSWSGACTTQGTVGDDILIGTVGDDVICGLPGADTLVGGGGDDLVRGGAGDDELNGGAGADLLSGGDGDDVLDGRGDGAADQLRCDGGSHDVAYLDPLDSASATCETVHRPAIAVDDAATVSEGDPPTQLRVRANDLRGTDSGAMVVTAVGDAAHGVAYVNRRGTRVGYVSDPRYCGADAFDYTLAGGSTATVSVSVECEES